MQKRSFLRTSPRAAFTLAAVACIAIVALIVWRLGLSLPLLPTWLVCVNVVAFAFYGWDKLQAMRDGWRVPEIVLHALSLLGGFVGAWLGRRTFRHKTREPLFLAIIILSAVLHVALLVWLYVL